MFIGRKQELAFLENIYQSNDLNFVCLTGTSQIGKTSFLKHFSNRKHSAYYGIKNLPSPINQLNFCTEMDLQNFKANSLWKNTLTLICQQAVNEKIIFIIDNAQNLEVNFPELLYYLIDIIKNQKKFLRLSIIFSGTVTNYIQTTLSKNNIKYHSLTLSALNFEETIEYLESFTQEEKLLLYGITGGIPKILSQINFNITFKDNLYNLFYNPNAMFLNIGEEILKQHFRKVEIYHSILSAIAAGNLKLNDIAQLLNIESNKLSKYINVLIKEDFLKRINKLDESGNKKNRQTFYIIKSTMIIFWYKHVFPYQSSILANLGNNILRNKVLNSLDSYGRTLFLRIGYEYCLTLKKRNNFSINFSILGITWKPELKTENDLRILALNQQEVCFIQCIWDKTKVDINILIKFQQDFTAYKNVYYILISKKGFTDKALAYAAQKNNWRLISLFYLK